MTPHKFWCAFTFLAALLLGLELGYYAGRADEVKTHKNYIESLRGINQW